MTTSLAPLIRSDPSWHAARHRDPVAAQPPCHRSRIVNNTDTMTTSVKELRRALARDLLSTAPSSPLPPIRTLARRFDASVGATQGALAGLASEGAVVLDTRPGRGGILVDR